MPSPRLLLALVVLVLGGCESDSRARGLGPRGTALPPPPVEQPAPR